MQSLLRCTPAAAESLSHQQSQSFKKSDLKGLTLGLIQANEKIARLAAAKHQQGTRLDIIRGLLFHLKVNATIAMFIRMTTALPGAAK